ncbi:MAG: DUF2878 domain-containing protein [Planctomycetota bacterium]|jgi:hypothetical protein
MAILLNLLLFQAVWWTSVLGAANDRPLLGVGALLIFVAVHLALSSDRSRDLKVLAAVSLVGGLADTALAYADIYAFRTAGPGGTPLPLWMWGLWANFSLTLFGALDWLRAKPLVALVLGAVSGPLTYQGAVALGALELPRGGASLAVLAVAWALLLPGLLALATRLDGAPERTSETVPV